MTLIVYIDFVVFVYTALEGAGGKNEQYNLEDVDSVASKMSNKLVNGNNKV